MKADWELELSSQSQPINRPHPLAEVLRQVDRQSCPSRFNFHCHTTFSDGSLGPEALVSQAVELGLEHLAITDHHSIAAYGPASQFLGTGPGPKLWTGVEISCLLEGCLVHVLGLGFDPLHPSLTPYLQGSAVVGTALQARAVLAAIHGASGLALLAHPARYRLPFATLLEAAAQLGFDGAEAWYDYQMQPSWQPTPHVCEAIATDLHKRGLLMSCGTDTHGLALDGR
ncbi:PHP domain-containing protein [Cyanobium sp. WAJ14-Wanaka]|uniref:PHP domain-containing protein n=1 Tax=Cyanobium sp. WAJ14-Wanaka TaxID=2823725 RepID=UPI0020CC279B|nr:PHP domain-containing protein [Cyanobium sp. WAJ14-Wanaka]MCP9774534.1 PHP domain-containing protein [Cyanobium sp. WAJ14-Wanaka]